MDIERFLRHRVRNFNGVFCVECFPCRVCWSATSILRACRVDIGSAFKLKTGVVNISTLSVDDQTRFFERYMNRHCSSWIFNDSQLQVLLVNFVDNTVYISAYFVTEV